MSKIIQETKTGEEPAVVKLRPLCLISRNQMNVEQASSLGSDASNVPMNPVLDSKFMLGSETCAKQKSKPSNVFSREERRQSASRKPLKTAAE